MEGSEIREAITLRVPVEMLRGSVDVVLWVKVGRSFSLRPDGFSLEGVISFECVCLMVVVGRMLLSGGLWITWRGRSWIRRGGVAR